jgi:hypothetical protein
MKLLVSGTVGFFLGLWVMHLINNPTRIDPPAIEYHAITATPITPEPPKHEPIIVRNEPPPVAPITTPNIEKGVEKVESKDESEKISAVLSAVQATSYTSSIYEMENSKEWSQLSPEAQQRVIIEIVRRVNAKEIPSTYLFPSTAP